ncbi:hypothetical protein L1987_01401 [Smallanthus sonchifolius]|uniref:Uncharacterized protein n=1 Tax=Smallanthus sonchifolius TaxID=185202 RepID=A0ACB9K4Z3_9ASTR|nr:hypothetical protein L1987_01401 [Smallanthus sonchifolius]
MVGSIPCDATKGQVVQICDEVGPVVSLRGMAYLHKDYCVSLMTALIFKLGMPHWGYASVKMMIGGLFKRVMELHHVTL